MFNPIKPYQETITGHAKEPQIRIGSVVPENAVNLGYYYNPTATDSEKVLTADAPRNTIDHRVEDAYRYLFDQASNDDNLFPKTVTYEDEEGYIGTLGRVYVKWHEEAHVTTKNIIEKKNYMGVVNKEDVPKIIEHHVDGFDGNLFLDAVDYTVSEYTTIGESKLVQRQILNHELMMYVEPKDLNFWMKDPKVDSSSPWPKTLTVNETMVINHGGRFVPNTALNPYDKFTGELVFDNIEYEEVRTSITPTPEFTSEIGIITFISATSPAGYVTAAQKDAEKSKFNALTKDLYKTSAKEPYDNTEIEEFLQKASLKYCPTKLSTPAYLDVKENVDNAESYGYTIQKVELKEHKIVDKDVTKYFFTKTFKVTKLTRGSDVKRAYAVYANYVGVLTKSVSTEKQVPYRYNAEAIYKGMARKVWYDYDGVAYYRGSIIKSQGIGNMNDELSNEVLMFPDASGKLFRLLATGKKVTKLEAEQFQITNVFKDNVPCWYQYKLKHPIYDYRPSDIAGFYTGENAKVYASNLKGIPDSEKYQIKLVPKEFETTEEVIDGVVTSVESVKNYSVYLYSSFLSKATNTYKVLYNGYLDGESYLNSNNGITEDIYNAPFFFKGKDYVVTEVDPVVRENEITILNPMVIKDTRRRITFSYKIVAKRKTDNKEVSSVTKTVSILNKEYALSIEQSQFIERAMIISPRSQDEYLSPMDIVLQDQPISAESPILTKASTDFVFCVEIVSISNEHIGGVNIRCNPDGSGILTAETTLDTGFYNQVSGKFTDKLSFNNPYYIEGDNIYGGYMVKCLDSRSIGLNQPREDKLLESWYPMIRFGHYSQTLSQYGIDKRIIYSMPEYDGQYYSEQFQKPYVEIKKEKAEILNNHMIKVKCTPLYLHDLEDINKNVVVKKFGAEELVLTVTDISYTDGVLFIKESISENDTIYVDYIYFEENYVYRGYWRDTDFCRIDLNPNQYHTYSDLNKIPSVTSPTKNLFNKTIYFYLRPSCYRAYEKWIEEVSKEVIVEKYVEETVTWTEEVPIWSEREIITIEKVYTEVPCESLSEIYNAGSYGDYPNQFMPMGNYALYGETVAARSLSVKKLFTKNLYQNFELEFIISVEENYSTLNAMNGAHIYLCSVYNDVKGAWQHIGLKVSPNRSSSSNINTNFGLFSLNVGSSPYILASDSGIKNETGSTWKSRWPNGMKIKIVKKDGNIKIYRSEPNATTLLPNPVINYDIPTTEAYRYFRNPGHFGIYLEAKGLAITMDSQTKTATTMEEKEVVTTEKYISGYETVEHSEVQLVKKEVVETVIEQIEHETRDETKNEITLYHTIDNYAPESEMDLYIGSVYIRQNTSLESTVLIDTRTRGGGVQESMKDELRKILEPESDYYLDIGYYDGKPYQENGVIIVRLDNRILKENGGRFTQSDVEEKVKKWMAFGVYPVIEYVDSYSKYEMPQYTLHVENSYTNVQYDPMVFYLDCVSI